MKRIALKGNQEKKGQKKTVNFSEEKSTGLHVRTIENLSKDQM